MALPPSIPTARGAFTVRPRAQGFALIQWNCSLRCTYTVRGDGQRRWAWDAFLALWSFRMAQAGLSDIPASNDPTAGGQQPGPPPPEREIKTNPGGPISSAWGAILAGAQKIINSFQPKFYTCIPYHFGIDEGLYLDSKTISFEASWYIVTSLRRVLLATGVWRQLELGPTSNRQFWALSMQDISGWRGNLVNALDPSQDVIIDLGG